MRAAPGRILLRLFPEAPGLQKGTDFSLGKETLKRHRMDSGFWLVLLYFLKNDSLFAIVASIPSTHHRLFKFLGIQQSSYSSSYPTFKPHCPFLCNNSLQIHAHSPISAFLPSLIAHSSPSLLSVPAALGVSASRFVAASPRGPALGSHPVSGARRSSRGRGFPSVAGEIQCI